MIKEFKFKWSERSPEQQGIIVGVLVFASAFTVAILAQPLDGAVRSVRRAIGGESFVIYQCSRAQQGNAGRFEAKKNLGLAGHEDIDYFCQFYTEKIQNIKNPR